MESDLVPVRRLLLTFVAPVILACALLPASASAAPVAIPSSVAFGTEYLGSTSSERTVAIEDSGPGPLVMTADMVTQGNSGDFAINGMGCDGARVVPPDHCNIRVTFSPSAIGTRESTLEVTFEGEEPIFVPLSGTGQTKKLVVPSSTGFATTTVGGTTSEKVLLKNSSENGVNVNEVKIEGAAAGDFGIEGNNCAGYIGVGMSCELSVGFSPSAVGTREATLRVLTDGSPAEYPVALSGQGAAPELVFEPGGHDFGLVEMHSGSPRTSFTVRNAGLASVQISNFEITGPGANEFWTPASTCWGSMLAPGATCGVEVQFNANEEGTYSAALTVTVAGTTFQAPLKGHAARPIVAASPSPLAFGPTAVGSRQVQEVTLDNVGELPVAFFISLVSGGNVADFHLLEETCTSNVFAGKPRVFEPGESCLAKIAFEPTSVGARHATLSIFGAGEGALQISLEGNAVAPQMSLTPATHDFGAVAVGADGTLQTFTLRNESGEPQTIDSALLAGPDVGEFQLRADGCTEATLLPGASCAVTVRFHPESIGPKTATLRLRGAGATSLAALSGEGTGGAVSAASQSSSLGRVTLTVASSPRMVGGKVTIGRARCESTEPCALRIGGLASGQIATRMGPRPAIRGVQVARLTLPPGASTPITAAVPPELRGRAGTRLSVSVQWWTGEQRGGGRHSVVIGGGPSR